MTKEQIEEKLASGSYTIPQGIDDAYTLSIVKQLLASNPDKRMHPSEFEAILSFRNTVAQRLKELKQAQQSNTPVANSAQQRPLSLAPQTGEDVDELMVRKFTSPKPRLPLDDNLVLVDADYSSDGTLFAALFTGETTIWKTDTWTCLHSIEYPAKMHSLSWHPTRHELLAGGEDGIYASGVHSGKHICFVCAARTRAVAWFSNQSAFVCSSADGYLCVYNEHSVQLAKYSFTDKHAYASAIAVVSDNAFVAVASDLDTNTYRACLFTFAQGTLALNWSVYGDGCMSKVSKVLDDCVLIASDGSQHVDVLNVQTKLMSMYPVQHAHACRCVYAGATFGYLVTGGNENIVVFDRQTRQHVGITRGHDETIRGFAIHPTNPMEFTSYNDKEFTVWHWKTRTNQVVSHAKCI